MLELKLDKTIRRIFVSNDDGSIPLPIFSSLVPAGFPSPADDHLEANLDLNQLLIKHPAATFFVRVSGDSMIGAGIHNNDILVVDRSLEAVHNSIVIAVIDGELTVKRLNLKGRRVILMPDNVNYDPIVIQDTNDLIIWGIVTSVIHQFRS